MLLRLFFSPTFLLESAKYINSLEWNLALIKVLDSLHFKQVSYYSFGYSLIGISRKCQSISVNTVNIDLAK